MEQGEQTRAPRRRAVAAVAGVVLVGAGAVAAWWFTTVHPGSHLGQPAHVTICSDSVASAGTERVMGGITVDPPAGATILDVRLVDPQNVEIADARIVPVVPDADGGTLIPGATNEWPITDADEYAVDWAADRDLVGAHLRPGVTEIPYLHLHVVDRDQPASFASWQVEYRMRATRWVSTLTIAFRMPLAPDTCDDV